MITYLAVDVIYSFFFSETWKLNLENAQRWKKAGHQKDQGSPQSQFRVPKSRMHIERSDYYKQDQWIN